MKNLEPYRTEIRNSSRNPNERDCTGFGACCTLIALFVVGMPSESVAVAEAVAIQAESGALGSDFITGEDGETTYISNTNNNIGFTSNRPQVLGRVATYDVTLPSVGTYELYARLRVGPGGANDDSFFYANGFGIKLQDVAGDWIWVQGIEARGFTDPLNEVMDGGSAGATVWKWVNLSQETGTQGVPPITFTALGNLTQTFQIGGREDGLDLDKFVFSKVGSPLTVADLDAITTPEPPPSTGTILMPALMANGDLSIKYYGDPNQEYISERAVSLLPPVMWSPVSTNTTDSDGLLTLTNTPSGSQEFYRFRSPPEAPSTLPLVYAVENTGAAYPAPPLPGLGNLPSIQPLPDPFCWADDPLNINGTRSTEFSDWSQRRAEIKAQIEHYETGLKLAVDQSMIFASVSGTGTSRTLTVRTTNIVEGVVRTLTQTSTITLPASSGTFPAIIGFNSPNGSIGLGGRPIATIFYNINQLTSYGSQLDSHPYYQLYAAPHSPALNSVNTGQYSAWAWGCSRLIDGLYKLNGDLGGGAQINLERIGVTGCSYAGKGALFCSALDERITLTIPQESGGGGVPNWRYSATEPSGTVEWLPNTDHNWFKEDMFTFGNGGNVSFLPEDHHLLLAMIAPRAVFATGNPDGAVWLSNPSCYVSCRAAERVYETFGIRDRIGWNINGGKPHCARTADLDNEVYAFLDKFLLGDTNANTLIRTAPYAGLDHSRWTRWWGTTSPTFTDTMPDDTYTIALEAECSTVGANWDILTDAQASNGRYVAAKPGLQSLSSPPVALEDQVTLPFSLTNSGNFAVLGRLNCPNADDDSIWVKMDDGSFVMRNGLRTSGWQWLVLNSYPLTAGDHTLTIGFREDGAKLDKISISTWAGAPAGTGQPAENICSP